MPTSLSKFTTVIIAGAIVSALSFSTFTQAAPLANDKEKITKTEKSVKSKALKSQQSAKSKLNKSKNNHKVRVNINTASAHQLMASLKGIGSKKAAAIVKYRKKNGKFTSIDDLLKVKGIGKKLMAKNNGRIQLSGKNTMKHTDNVNKKAKKAKKSLTNKSAKLSNNNIKDTAAKKS